MKSDRPLIVRTCKCHCGHEWNWEVEFSPVTPKLTGERNRTCPKCGKDAFTASPWRILSAGKLYEIINLEPVE